MAQLGVVYKFTVRESGKPQSPFRQLGSIDNAGKPFFEAAPGILKTINSEGPIDGFDKPQPIVTFKSEVHIPEEYRCAAVMNHHEYGSSGILKRHMEGDETPFSTVDNQRVDAALVLSAPPMATVGFIAFQVPNRRGIKTAVVDHLGAQLKDQFHLHLDVKPVVPTDALEAAIQMGLGFVSFRKLTKPAGMFGLDDRWWEEGEDLGGVELRLKPSRSARLFGGRLGRFIQTKNQSLPPDQDPVVFDDLVTFNDQTYDELSVEVFLDGRKKVLKISPDGASMSHAFSWDLELDGDGSPSSVVAALGGLLPTQ